MMQGGLLGLCSVGCWRRYLLGGEGESVDGALFDILTYMVWDLNMSVGTTDATLVWEGGEDENED